jgi:hypothetical protein
MPTTQFALDGLEMDPSVATPMPMVARFAARATAVPELDPQADRSRTYGFFVKPPRALQPAGARCDPAEDT